MNLGESHTLKKSAEKEMEPKEEMDEMKEYIEYSLEVFSLFPLFEVLGGMQELLKVDSLSRWQNATKETIIHCEIVYNPALSCVKLPGAVTAIQRMGHLRAGESGGSVTGSHM